MLLPEIEENGEIDSDASITYEERHYVSGSDILKTCNLGSNLRIRDLENWMIAVSGNFATNMLIGHVGMDVLHHGIRRPGFESTRILNRLDFTKWHTFDNTIPEDYGQLLSDIALGTLVSTDVSQSMLGVLLKQQHNPMPCGKIAPYLLNTYNKEQNTIFVASKRGTVNQARNDVKIFLTPNGAFALQRDCPNLYSTRESQLLFSFSLQEVCESAAKRGGW